MLRKLFRSGLLVLLLAPFAAAQFTLVSGTVVDPNGTPYALGTITAQVITAGVSPTVNGQSFAMTGSSGLDLTGSFTMQLVSSTAMSPNLQWSFKVCSAIGTVQPAGGPGPVCFISLITITGATQSISGTLSAAAPALTNAFPPVNSAGAIGSFYSDGHLSPLLPAFVFQNLANSTANAVWCDQFVLSNSFTINQITILSGLAGTDSVGIGLYSTAGNRLVSALYTNIGANTLSTASILQGTVNVSPGAYFYCWSESTTSAGVTYEGFNLGNFGGNQNSTGAICIRGTNTATVGSLPATLGVQNILTACPGQLPFAQFSHS